MDNDLFVNANPMDKGRIGARDVVSLSIKTRTFDSYNPQSTYTTFYGGGITPVATTSGTDTTPVSGTVYICAVFIPQNVILTGISYLIGSVGGTNKVISALYDSHGLLLANSLLTGATVGTSATWQRLPFVSKYPIRYPGLFFISISMNGNTARLRTHASGDHPTKSITGTFGSLANIVVPTTFTANTGPYSMTY